jgi:hypothetical protein
MRKTYWLVLLFVIASLIVWVTLGLNSMNEISPKKFGLSLSLAIGLIVTLATWFAKNSYDSWRETWRLQEAVKFYARAVTREEFQQMLDRELISHAKEVDYYAKALATLSTEGLRGTGKQIRPGCEPDDLDRAVRELRHRLESAEKAFSDRYALLRQVSEVCCGRKLRDGGWKAYAPVEQAKTGTDG